MLTGHSLKLNGEITQHRWQTGKASFFFRIITRGIFIGSLIHIPAPGVYKIVVQDPNRNAGVLNIPNSVNVVFSISTILIVNPVNRTEQYPGTA